ncbi:MAG: methyltransferase domain-containing protein [Pseudomonadota bacterium]
MSSPVSTPAWKRALGQQVLNMQGALSSAGQALGWEWLVYNPLATYSFRRAALRNAPGVVRTLRAAFPQAHRVVDVGCASGIYVKEMNDRGLQAIGVEYSPKLRARAAAQGLAAYPFDLARQTPHPPGAPFDLALSLEVAEHVPGQFADAFAGYFRGLSDTVVFTAAQPGQGGPGHVNEQPRAYWIDKFAAAGFALDEERTHAVREGLLQAQVHWYLPANVCVFRRR